MSEPTQSSRPLPLDGITVLDLGQIYQGPYAGFLMAMAGARVIKVEHRRGEPLRARGPSLSFAMLNSAKEAVTLDLKKPEGRDLFLELATKADVVSMNYAPGVPERLGIGFEDLSAVNPQIVYAHACGFGLTGGDASTPAMDITVQAHMGVMAATGYPDRPPVKAGVAFIDILGGTHLYAALMTGLFERERTGMGRKVEVVMSDATYFTLTTNMLAWHQTGESPRTGNKHASLGVAPYDAYECSDGHIALIAVTNRHWRSILALIDREDLLDDPRYMQNADRAAHMADVDALVSGWTSTRPRAEVVAALQGAHVPAAAIRDIDEVVHDQVAIERLAVQWIDHPELGEVPLPHSPIRFHGSDLAELKPNPGIGAHNQLVYGELLGLSDERLAELAAAEII